MGFLLSEGYEKSTASQTKNNRFDYWRETICNEYVQLDCDSQNKEQFNGVMRGGVNVSQLQFSEIQADRQHVVRSSSQIAKSQRDDFLISFQMRERGLVRQSGREAILNPGCFVLYDSSEPYSLSFDQPFHQLVVQMPKTVLSQHLANPEQYTAVSVCGKSGLGAVLSNFIFSMAQEVHCLENTPDNLIDNLLNMIAIAFSSSIQLDQLKGSCVISDSLRHRIRRYIDNNMNDPGLSNQSIADAQGISVRYLNKLFQDEPSSVHQLILSKRLNKAKLTLADSAYENLSIEQLAYGLGYSSPAHFSRSFKRHFGVNPSEMRIKGGEPF